MLLNYIELFLENVSTEKFININQLFTKVFKSYYLKILVTIVLSNITLRVSIYDIYLKTIYKIIIKHNLLETMYNILK